MDEEIMADSESQILQPLLSVAAASGFSNNLPIKAFWEIRDGNFLEASSSNNSSSSSLGSDEYWLGLNGDDTDDGDEGVLPPWSNLEGFKDFWELFLLFEGILQKPA